MTGFGLRYRVQPLRRVGVAEILHLRRCQRKYDTYPDVFVQRLAESLFVLPRVAFPSLDFFNRLQQNVFGCGRYCSRWRALLLLSYLAFSPRHASVHCGRRGVFHRHQGVSFAQQCQRNATLKIVLPETLFHHSDGSNLVFLHRSPMQCFTRLGIRGSHVCCENWDDQSGQSLCSPVNLGALSIVRASTSGAVTFGTGATCCRVSTKARSLSLHQACHQHVSSHLSFCHR